MSPTRHLPSYLEQSEAVRNRFDRLKSREVILEVKHLGKDYKTTKGNVTALKDVNFKTHRREFVCVIGPSGCGKSTLIRILAGLESHTSGEVLLDGKPVTGPGRARGMVFQGYTLFPWLTVKKNVMFGLETNNVSADEASREAELWLELIGLEKFANAFPHELSGGMKQRVAIARGMAPGTLSSDVLALLADAVGVFGETVGGLDAVLEEVEGKLTELALAKPADRSAYALALKEKVQAARESVRRAYDPLLDLRSFDEAAVEGLVVKAKARFGIDEADAEGGAGIEDGLWALARDLDERLEETVTELARVKVMGAGIAEIKGFIKARREAV